MQNSFLEADCCTNMAEMLHTEQKPLPDIRTGLILVTERKRRNKTECTPENPERA